MSFSSFTHLFSSAFSFLLLSLFILFSLLFLISSISSLCSLSYSFLMCRSSPLPLCLFHFSFSPHCLSPPLFLSALSFTSLVSLSFFSFFPSLSFLASVLLDLSLFSLYFSSSIIPQLFLTSSALLFFPMSPYPLFYFFPLLSFCLSSYTPPSIHL